MEKQHPLNDLMSKIMDFKVYIEYDLHYDDMVMSSEMVLNDMAEFNEFCTQRKLNTRR